MGWRVRWNRGIPAGLERAAGVGSHVGRVFMRVSCDRKSDGCDKKTYRNSFIRHRIFIEYLYVLDAEGGGPVRPAWTAHNPTVRPFQTLRPRDPIWLRPHIATASDSV